MDKHEVSPDKVVIHKDRIAEYEKLIKELQRQASELYPIMKFEQKRANKATECLREIVQLIQQKGLLEE